VGYYVRPGIFPAVPASLTIVRGSVFKYRPRFVPTSTTASLRSVISLGVVKAHRVGEFAREASCAAMTSIDPPRHLCALSRAPVHIGGRCFWRLHSRSRSPALGPYVRASLISGAPLRTRSARPRIRSSIVPHRTFWGRCFCAMDYSRSNSAIDGAGYQGEGRYSGRAAR